MQKIMVRFFSEGMNIIPLLRIFRDESRIGSEIGKYLKDCGFEINYCEYIVLKSVFPKFFEKYSYSFYSHGSSCQYYFTQEKLIDSLVRFSGIYEFHEKINYKTKHLFLGNEIGINKILHLINGKVDIKDIVLGFMHYRKIYKNIPESVYFYLSTLIYIFIAKEQNILNIKSGLIQLSISPEEIKFRKSEKVPEKFFFNELSLREIAHYFYLIRKKFSQKRAFKSVFFITKHPEKNTEKIDFLRDFFLSSFYTGISTTTYSPFDFIDIDTSQENLFIVFEDSKLFFDKLGFFRNTGIFINDEK